ncbi:MAG TPA: hypothetical protein VEG60_10180 [Candidatus Binatia bacterium]|nr:hypothetical protein [Candidatus Binatia bacterium]
MKPIFKTFILNRLALIFLGLIIVLASGCVPKHQDEELAGVSVPIPAGMKKLPTSSNKLDLGPGQKGEQASFRGEIPREEIVRFYIDVLPTAEWQPDAELGREIDGYAFKRGNQVIAIRIQEGSAGVSTLTVMAKVGEFHPSSAGGFSP